MSNEALAGIDIAVVNLSCTEGLPGAEKIDIPACVNRLDEWAESVRSYTCRALPQYRRRPHEYENSESYFRALCLITVLQRDLGVRYNPGKIPADTAFDTADSFIHGILHGDGGTCATMPVVYAAVGRRLGYPIFLVSARGEGSGHLFARWQDGRTGERFNIEAAGQGMSTPDDNYFRTGRYEISSAVEAAGRYLKSQTPREELAGFLKDRAWCWEDAKDWWRCVDALAWAASLAETETARNGLKRGLAAWSREQEARRPLGFPPVQVQAVRRLFPPTLPMELEKQVFSLTAVQHMLDDPRLDKKYWRGMRQGERIRVPKVAVADFAPNERCQISLKFD